MKRNLEEIQNYLEYLYHNIDNETESIDITVEVFNDLRDMFNACIIFLANSTQIQRNTSLAMVISLVVNFLLVLVFVFKI